MPSPFAKSRLWRLLAALAATPLLAAALWHLLAALLPFPYDPFQAGRPATLEIVAGDGTLLRRVLPPDGLDYRPLYRASTNDAIVQALVAVEDARFFRHGALDPLALLRAVAQNLASGRRVSGASTLSTQVIRLLEPAPRTLPTKLREAFRATQLEQRCSKSDILTAYLRLAPFGGNIVGIDAAADRYFATTPDRLALHEAALLAGLPQSPSRSRPDRRPDRALLRRSHVLRRMAECGFVSPAQAAEADRQPLVLRSTPAFPSLAPHFCDFVLARRPPGPPPPDGVIRTTLSLPIQRIAERALAAHLAAPPFASQPRLSGAVVILSATNAAILAMAGSPDYASPNAGQFNACLAPRSPGSTLKPFLYAMAFDRGLIAPASLLSDAPVAFRDFAPQNYSRLFGSSATAREALVQSLNLPAVDLLRRAGVPAFYRFLADGLRLPLRRPAARYGLGLALGAPDLPLLDLAAAYRTIAAPGPFRPPAATPGDLAKADALAHASPSAAPVSPAAAFLVTDILSGPDRPFDATGHAANVPLPAVAWKTGTSAGLRDAWTFAWTPSYVVGTWIGDPSGAPSPLLVGRSAAAPLAWSIFRQLHPGGDSSPPVAPPDVETRDFCPLSGHLATPACPEPHVQDLAIRRRTLFVPCPLHGPGAAAGADKRPGPPGPPAPGAPELAITQPSHGSTLLIPPSSPAIDPAVALSARSDRPGPLYWFLDDRLLAFATSPVRWPPVPGEHVLVVVHPDGPSASASFTVLPPP